MSKIVQIIIPQGSRDDSEARKVAERFNADVSVVRYMGSSEVMSALQRVRDKYMEVPHDGSERVYARQIAILTELSNYRAIVERENGSVLSVRGYGLGDGIEELKFSTSSNTTKQKKAGCFISTATSEYMGRPDNCYELEVLRKFRDDVLLNNIEYERLVSEYYEISPGILRSGIIQSEYGNIWKTIVKIVKLIELGESEAAVIAYKNMIYFLMRKN